MIAIGADPDRAVTIPYGVDAQRFRPDAARRAEGRGIMGAGPDDLVLFTAGRFVRKKGFEFLVDAAALLRPRWPALRLVIGGGGDLDAELRDRVRSRGMQDRVGFPGVLAQDDVARCLAGADVAVVPSVRDEAGNVDGLPNTALASAIDRLLADGRARANLGSTARADVLRRHTWDAVAEAFEQVYDRAAGRAERRLESV
jgi:glycosyltransferase involved in cell wall biosynthesis